MNKMLSGKTCLVTGANSGIGKALSTALADFGANIIMVCRNQVRGEKALTNLLWDILIPSAPSRIINVVSEGTKRCLDFDRLLSEKNLILCLLILSQSSL